MTPRDSRNIVSLVIALMSSLLLFGCVSSIDKNEVTDIDLLNAKINSLELRFSDLESNVVNIDSTTSDQESTISELQYDVSAL